MPLYSINALDDVYYVEAPSLEDAVKAFVGHTDAESIDSGDIESIALVSRTSVIR